MIKLGNSLLSPSGASENASISISIKNIIVYNIIKCNENKISSHTKLY